MGIAYNTSIVRDGLVLHLDAANKKSYPGSGNTWSSLTLPKTSITLTGSPTFSTNNSGSFIFDGSTMYASTGLTLNSLSTTNPYSLETVAKRSTSTDDDIVWGWQGFNCGILMQNNIINASNWYSNGSGGWLNTTATGIVAQLDTWYHIVLTFNANGFMRIYVNGVNYGSINVSGFTASSGNVWFYSSLTFAGAGFAGYRFPGSISLGRIYNKELSKLEVRQNFEAIRGRYGI